MNDGAGGRLFKRWTNVGGGRASLSWQLPGSPGVITYALLVFTLALVPIATIRSTGAQDDVSNPGCGEWAVATAPLPPGSPLVDNEVVLTRPDGGQVMTIPFEQPASVSPATLEERSLIRSLGGEYGLLNSTTGRVTMLEFPGADPGGVGHDSYLSFESSGVRYHLFGDPVSLAGYLVDLQTGESLALADLTDDAKFVLRGAVSADDQWLTFYTGRQSYLVRLSANGQAAPVDEENTGFAAFAEDSRVLVFQRETGSETTEIVARILQSGKEQIVAPSDKWSGVATMSGDVVLAWRKGHIVRVWPDGAEPVPIIAGSGDLYPMMVDPLGEYLLVWQPEDERDAWHLASLDGTGAIELRELEGMSVLLHSRMAGWALFAADPAPMQGTSGTPYLSLDLTTGNVTTLLTQDGDDIYTSRLSASADGRYELVQSISTARGRLWLLDAAAGTSTLVAESTGNVAGALTPDGCFLATSSFDALGEGRQGSVEVIDLKSGEVATTITDAVLLGWASL